MCLAWSCLRQGSSLTSSSRIYPSRHGGVNKDQPLSGERGKQDEGMAQPFTRRGESKEMLVRREGKARPSSSRREGKTRPSPSRGGRKARTCLLKRGVASGPLVTRVARLFFVKPTSSSLAFSQCSWLQKMLVGFLLRFGFFLAFFCAVECELCPIMYY